MTYNEYLQKQGAYNPQTILNDVVASTELYNISVNDMFVARYGHRTLIFDDVERFASALKYTTVVNSVHFKPIIAAINSANADLIKNQERITKIFAAPNGSIENTYITGGGSEVISNDKNDLSQLTNYVKQISIAIDDYLSQFESLFCGVI